MTEQNRYKLQDFWNYINNDSNNTYEVRIRDYKIVKHIATEFKLPFYSGGVFVNTYEQLYSVIKCIRQHTTAWISVNPKRRVNGKHGGKDLYIESINHIFLDIDRINGDGEATAHEKQNIHKFVNLLIEHLNNIGITNYCRIDSGNGEQLIIKLDEPILMPIPEFKDGVFIPSEQHTKYKQLIKKVFIEKLIKKFNTKYYKDKYGCEIDRSCSNIGRVCALHGTFNFKHSAKTLRKVIEIQDTTENTGLSDALFKEFDNLDLPVFNKTSIQNKPLKQEFKITTNTIHNSELVKLLLSTELPSGNRNSHLIFQLKCLLKDNNIPLTDTKVITLFKQIESVQNDTYPMNDVEVHCHFNPNVINNYCISHSIKPIYDVWYDKPRLHTFDEHIFTYNNYRPVSTSLKVLNIKYSNVHECMFEFSKIWDGSIDMLYRLFKTLEAKYDIKWLIENVLKYYCEKIMPKFNVQQYLFNVKNGLNGLISII